MKIVQAMQQLLAAGDCFTQWSRTCFWSQRTLSVTFQHLPGSLSSSPSAPPSWFSWFCEEGQFTEITPRTTRTQKIKRALTKHFSDSKAHTHKNRYIATFDAEWSKRCGWWQQIWSSIPLPHAHLLRNQGGDSCWHILFPFPEAISCCSQGTKISSERTAKGSVPLMYTP